MHSQKSSINKAVPFEQESEQKIGRHHPGYHSLIAQSWWCDHCLQDCQAMHAHTATAGGRWYDFWPWLGGLLARGFAAMNGAAFAFVAYIIGGMAVKQPPLTAQQAVWQRELNLQLAQRDQILYGIAKLRTAQFQASIDGDRPTVRELANRTKLLQDSLIDCDLEIRKLRDLLADESARPAQWSIPHDFNLR